MVLIVVAQMAEEMEAVVTDAQKAMYLAGSTIAKSDDETIFGLIADMATRSNVSVLGSQILYVAEREHWSVQRTALALAYTFMLRDEGHISEMQDLQERMVRPIIMHLHCKTCTCENKGLNYEDS